MPLNTLDTALEGVAVVIVEGGKPFEGVQLAFDAVVFGGEFGVEASLRVSGTTGEVECHF